MNANNSSKPISVTEETLSVGLRFLSDRNPDLATILGEVGPPPIWGREPGFPTLVRIILEPQVSLASAKTASDRLLNAATPLTPESFLPMDEITLKRIGFSRQKTRYCRHLEPGDRLAEIHTILQFSRQLLWGYRGDGYLFSSQDGYRSPILERAWIDRFQREAEPLDREENRQTFRELNAVTKLLGFLVHFDCRAGLGDTGPYDLGDGKLLIVRDHFLREEVSHWCDVCEGLPYAVTLAFILHAGRMGLKEIRVNDISTTFTWPRNYSPHITHAAYYVRPEWNSRPEEIRQIGFSDARVLTRQAREATLKLYKKLSRMSRRQLITNGIYVYVVDLVLPYARLTGLYKTFCRDYDLWELNPEVSTAYYRFGRDEFRFGFFPGFLAGGEAFIPIPTQAYW